MAKIRIIKCRISYPNSFRPRREIHFDAISAPIFCRRHFKLKQMSVKWVFIGSTAAFGDFVAVRPIIRAQGNLHRVGQNRKIKATRFIFIWKRF